MRTAAKLVVICFQNQKLFLGSLEFLRRLLTERCFERYCGVFCQTCTIVPEELFAAVLREQFRRVKQLEEKMMWM